MTRPGLTRRLGRDQRGATLVEFGLVSPVLFLFMFGGLEMAHTLYTNTTIQGAVQKAARDSGLESADTTAAQAALDAKVTTAIKQISKNSTVTFSRRYYKSFTKASAKQQEAFTDTNSNGTCDAGEPYQDGNNNSSWDKDGGDSGQGGARDDVVYTVTATYKRIFPIYKLMGLSTNATVVATTVLANQPFGDQAQYGAATVRNCP